ncbi:MAG: Mur ligase family protein, partial [Planctomycetaceae bacterium]
ALSPIPVDDVTRAVLEEQGLDESGVPEAGRQVRLRRNANLSTGGTAEDVTDLVHPDVAARAAEAAQIVGLDVAGIDIVAQDVSRPLEAQGGAVIEVNAAPGLRMHLQPSAGRPRDVGGAIVSTLFEPGDDGRIPIAAVTGTNGKTTVTRLIAHCAGLAGGTVGMTCSEGVWVGERMIDAGDCSGPRSARRVLAHPSVTTAVFETARGGIIREGCGFDACDVAVVTNIASGDHLGIDGIDTPERLAWVKGAIVAAVRPTGAAVLNAADPLVVDMRRWCKGQVVYFALDSENPVLKNHLQEGGLAATVRDQWIVLCDGPRETRLAHIGRVPLAHGGLVSFQVENALAAAAAAWRLGVPLELVRLGLEGFSAGIDGSPARFNVIEIGGAAVVVDYGHNVPSLGRICEALSRLPHTRRTAVYSAAGDRRDADLIEQGRMLAASFDRVILYEDACVRGREPGEITRLISAGIRQGTTSERQVEVLIGGGWCESAALALDTAGPGHLVLLQPDTVEQTVEWMRNRYGESVRSVSLQDLLGASAEEIARIRFDGTVEIRSGGNGTTLHAARAIEPGEMVIRAGGRRSSEPTRLTMQVERDVHVVPDNSMVHVRHACEPNCGVIITAGSTDIEMHSLRRIEPGEELTLDYATFEWEVPDGGGPCHCGSPACRGRIGGYRHLPVDVIARYGDFIAEYLRAADPDRAVPTWA